MSTKLLSVEHEDWAGAGRLVAPLRHALPGLVLDVVRPYRGDVLPDDARAAGYQGLIVLGGTMGAWDDALVPWLAATRALLRRAVETDLPTLAICLGCELLAAATGGQVRRGGAGLEVGVCDVELLPAARDDALLGALAGQRPAAGPGGAPGFRSSQWHSDAVVELPPGAVLLATGRQYPHQAFRLGRFAWGVQYHPEVTLADWAAWCEEGTTELRAAGRDRHGERAAAQAADGDLERLAEAHAVAFAAVVAGGTGSDVAEPRTTELTTSERAGLP